MDLLALYRFHDEHPVVEYVTGFMFDKNNPDHVLLIQKRRPEWKEGFLNGLGSKMECGETPHASMVRGFKEECGFATVERDWTHFASHMYFGGVFVHFFSAEVDHKFLPHRSIDGVARWVDWNAESQKNNAVKNAYWLIPQAIQMRRVWKEGFDVYCEVLPTLNME